MGPRESAKSTKPATIDEYLGRLSPDKRGALQKLRRAIKVAAPRVEECISYQIPAFRLDGKVLVWFGAAENHCSFFPGAASIKACATELAEYETSKGTIRFAASDPLPPTLVKKLVRVRIAELAAPRPTRKRAR